MDITVVLSLYGEALSNEYPSHAYATKQGTTFTG